MINKHAVLVGIDKCNDGSITPLKGATNDTRRLAAFFEDRLRFNQVKALTDDDLRRGEDVIDSLTKSVEALGENDLFVFFFAGHGKSVRDANGKPDQILLLHNANRISLEKGFFSSFTLSLAHIEAITQKAGVRRLFIFDTCRLPIELELAENRDGEAQIQFDGEEIYRDVAMRAPRSSMGSIDSPVTILNGCANGQRAVEIPGERRGLYALTLQEAWAAELELGKPLVIDAQFDQFLERTMDKVAGRFNVRRGGQRPVRVGPELRLFSTEDRTGAETVKFMAEFEVQLQAGRLDLPVGDNCRDTLSVLISKGLPWEQQRELSARLQLAIDARKNTQDRAHDERLIVHARQYPTPANYSSYLVQNKLGEYAEEARQFLDGQNKARQESETWASARRSDLKEDYEYYLLHFQNGLNSGFARQRLDELASVSDAEGERLRDAKRRTEAADAPNQITAWRNVLGVAGEAQGKIETLLELDRLAVENARLSRESQILAEFESHLKAGHLDQPGSNCCMSVLSQLRIMEVGEQKIRELSNRLEVAYDERAYAEAKRINSEQSYLNYLEQHPKGKFRTGAEICIVKSQKAEAERLDNKLFIKAKLAGTVEALEQYKTQSKTKGRWAEADALVLGLRTTKPEAAINPLNHPNISSQPASEQYFERDLHHSANISFSNDATAMDEVERRIVEFDKNESDFFDGWRQIALGVFPLVLTELVLYFKFFNEKLSFSGVIIGGPVTVICFGFLIGIIYLVFRSPLEVEISKLTTTIETKLVSGDIRRWGHCRVGDQSEYLIRKLADNGKKLEVVPRSAIPGLLPILEVSIISQEKRRQGYMRATVIWMVFYCVVALALIPQGKREEPAPAPPPLPAASTNQMR